MGHLVDLQINSDHKSGVSHVIDISSTTKSNKTFTKVNLVADESQQAIINLLPALMHINSLQFDYDSIKYIYQGRKAF